MAGSRGAASASAAGCWAAEAEPQRQRRAHMRARARAQSRRRGRRRSSTTLPGVLFVARHTQIHVFCPTHRATNIPRRTCDAEAASARGQHRQRRPTAGLLRLPAWKSQPLDRFRAAARWAVRRVGPQGSVCACGLAHAVPASGCAMPVIRRYTATSSAGPTLGW